jgi:dihydroorotase
MLRAVLPHTMRQFKRAVIMPTTIPPILTPEDVVAYRKEILTEAHGSGFEPLMTIQITENTKPEIIPLAKAVGVVAGKVYPRGMTSHSENGVADYKAIYPVLRAMQECGMLALFHGESPEPDVFCLDREVKFLGILTDIAAEYPGLKIVMEHCTTAAGMERVLKLNHNVVATITVHHLFLTLNDVVGDKFEPHHFCKPLANRPEDREKLLIAARSGNRKFFLGTDSVPYLQGAKECASGCEGIYTAPVAIPLLVQLFENIGHLNKLEGFCSRFGADFYGLPQNTETIKLVREKWMVPPSYDGVVPFYAGKEIQWQIE